MLAAAVEAPEAPSMVVTARSQKLQAARERFHSALKKSEDDLPAPQPFGAKRAKIMYPAGDEPDAEWESVRIKHRRQEVNIIAASSSRSGVASVPPGDAQAPAPEPEAEMPVVAPPSTMETQAPEASPPAEMETETLETETPVAVPTAVMETQAPEAAIAPTAETVLTVPDDTTNTGPELANENAAGNVNTENIGTAARDVFEALAQLHGDELPTTILASAENIAAAMDTLGEGDQIAAPMEVPAPVVAVVAEPIVMGERPRRERRAPNRFVPGTRN
jgi:hypothetical protein